MAENAENVPKVDETVSKSVTNSPPKDTPTGETTQTLATTEQASATPTAPDKEIPLDELERQLNAGEKTKDAETADATAQSPDQKPVDTSEQSEALEQTDNTGNKADRRYQTLANRNRELEEENRQLKAARQNALRQEIGLQNPPWLTDPAATPSQVDFPFKEGDVVSPEEFQKQVLTRAHKIAQAQIEANNLRLAAQEQNQRRAVQFDQDIAAIKTKYPELDANSEHYQPELDNYVAQMISNAQIAPERIKGAIEAIMQMRHQASSDGASQASQKLKQQVSQAAITSSSAVASPSVDYNSIPLDELENKIGIIS